jgi:hypothetical protein
VSSDKTVDNGKFIRCESISISENSIFAIHCYIITISTAKKQVQDVVVFDILKAVAMKSSLTWDIILRSPEKVN